MAGVLIIFLFAATIAAQILLKAEAKVIFSNGEDFISKIGPVEAYDGIDILFLPHVFGSNTLNICSMTLDVNQLMAHLGSKINSIGGLKIRYAVVEGSRPFNVAKLFSDPSESWSIEKDADTHSICANSHERLVAWTGTYNRFSSGIYHSNVEGNKSPREDYRKRRQNSDNRAVEYMSYEINDMRKQLDWNPNALKIAILSISAGDYFAPLISRSKSLMEYYKSMIKIYPYLWSKTPCSKRKLNRCKDYELGTNNAYKFYNSHMHLLASLIENDINLIVVQNMSLEVMGHVKLRSANVKKQDEMSTHVNITSMEAIFGPGLKASSPDTTNSTNDSQYDLHRHIIDTENKSIAYKIATELDFYRSCNNIITHINHIDFQEEEYTYGSLRLYRVDESVEKLLERLSKYAKYHHFVKDILQRRLAGYRNVNPCRKNATVKLQNEKLIYQGLPDIETLEQYFIPSPESALCKSIEDPYCYRYNDKYIMSAESLLRTREYGQEHNIFEPEFFGDLESAVGDFIGSLILAEINDYLPLEVPNNIAMKEHMKKNMDTERPELYFYPEELLDDPMNKVYYEIAFVIPYDSLKNSRSLLILEKDEDCEYFYLLLSANKHNGDAKHRIKVRYEIVKNACVTNDDNKKIPVRSCINSLKDGYPRLIGQEFMRAMSIYNVDDDDSSVRDLKKSLKLHYNRTNVTYVASDDDLDKDIKNCGAILNNVENPTYIEPRSAKDYVSPDSYKSEYFDERDMKDVERLVKLLSGKI